MKLYHFPFGSKAEGLEIESIVVKVVGCWLVDGHRVEMDDSAELRGGVGEIEYDVDGWLGGY